MTVFLSDGGAQSVLNRQGMSSGDLRGSRTDTVGLKASVQSSWLGGMPVTPGKAAGSSARKADRTNHLILKMRSEQQSDDENLLNELWMPTFSFWSRLECFWRAPITLFYLALLYRTALVVVSIWYITQLQTVFFEAIHKGGGTERSKWGPDAYDRLEAFSNSTAERLTHELSLGSLTDTLQWVLAAHFCMALILETIKLCICSQGLFWMVLDTVGSACFLTSILIKYQHVCALR